VQKSFGAGPFCTKTVNFYKSATTETWLKIMSAYNTSIAKLCNNWNVIVDVGWLTDGGGECLKTSDV